MREMQKVSQRDMADLREMQKVSQRDMADLREQLLQAAADQRKEIRRLEKNLTAKIIHDGGVVRLIAGGYLPDDFKSVLLHDLPSLMSYLEYLKRCSCMPTVRWPETSDQLLDRVLLRLCDPVRGAFVLVQRVSALRLPYVEAYKIAWNPEFLMFL